MKILCTADIHIGRRSSRLPQGPDAPSYSCADAWLRVVEVAIDEGVDIVTICGDLVDEDNRYFEAFGILERGLRRLVGEGIDVVLVTGNHDHDVLPRLIDSIGLERVRLLGRGGRWERMEITRGDDRVLIDGWSFPAGRYPENPLSSYAPAPAGGAPILCMLHGDLDVPRSPYAPISLAELRRHPETLFLLGHVHAPRWINEPGGAKALYPGSPQAMDAAEPGSHGAYILKIDGDGFHANPYPVSSARYERIDVDVDGIDRRDELPGLIVSAIRDRLSELTLEEPRLRHAHCRIRLIGTSPIHRELDGDFTETVRELETEVGALSASVERVDVATRPARDLEAIRTIPGAPGVLANFILSMEGGDLDPQQEQLLRDGLRTVQSVRRSSTYVPVLETGGDSGEDNQEVRETLIRLANLLLDEMLAQRDPAA